MGRNPVVHGQFYPAKPEILKKDIENYLGGKATKEKVLGAMVPHAGYIYSGKVAGSVYARIKLPLKLPVTVVLIGPNHHGLGTPSSIVTQSFWITPLGDIFIDQKLAEKILKNSKFLEDDSLAHSREHSLEVQLPFLQYLKPDIQFVPIAMYNYGLDFCRDLGRAIAKAIKDSDKEVMVIASSDMTHYESANQAQRKDKIALDQILSLNPEKLLEVVGYYDISMCGSGPAAAMLFACKELGATKAELTLYQTSGDATGDFEQVVGYAGIIVK